MTDLKACRICLRAQVKVYKYDTFQLKSYYEEVMAQKLNPSDGLPCFFCYECAILLLKFHKFKEKCYTGQKVLKEINWIEPITYESINKVNRKSYSLESSLETFKISDKIKYYTVNNSQLEIKEQNQRSTQYLTKTCDNVDDKDIVDSECKQMNDNASNMQHSPVALFVEIKKEPIVLSSSQFRIKTSNSRSSIKRNFVKCNSSTKQKIYNIDDGYWTKYNLIEEQAVQMFNRKSLNATYKKAMFKCTDCFKGFSKEEMLKRHYHIRHRETIGKYECRFCHSRFKWRSHMEIHMRQHFTVYECKRCSFRCSLENTASLHEELHSGVGRTCRLCGEKFRHASTYYSHLRSSHRSSFVCSQCGASFHSITGLNLHTKIKHLSIDVHTPDDDDDDRTSYCNKCDINFDTSKAYEEHFSHSLLHANDPFDKHKMLKKNLGRKQKVKISNGLRPAKCKEEDLSDSKNKKRCKKQKRLRRKPTTCYQCGQKFASQAACMQHHRSEHPNTSFYSERHVCEICGATLAPGSVASHQNIHSREKIYSCEYCNKTFYSYVAHKRHLVTHTGEKKFACSACDKRFTQSNSMKLHYRTVHLKQPYPKRNRRQPVAVLNENSQSTGPQEEQRDQAVQDVNHSVQVLAIDAAINPDWNLAVLQ